MLANQPAARQGRLVSGLGWGIAEANRHLQLRTISKKASKADVGRAVVDLVCLGV